MIYRGREKFPTNQNWHLFNLLTMKEPLSNKTTRRLGITEEELSEIVVDISKAIAENDMDTLTDFIMDKVTRINDEASDQAGRYYSSMSLMSVLEKCEKGGDILPTDLQRKGWAAVMNANSDIVRSCRKGINSLLDCGWTIGECQAIAQQFADKALRKLVLIY